MKEATSSETGLSAVNPNTEEAPSASANLQDHGGFSTPVEGPAGPPVGASPPVHAIPGGDLGRLESNAESRKSKRPAPVKRLEQLPLRYENCEIKDLVQLIGYMLLDLMLINDKIPLQEGTLTRFHSRVAPGISVMDYLHRLATHASLSPPILLSMVYYIDKLCALYPAFTITSLTVHRYLIASATVASKGLSDTFWTNGTYARVGGASLKELGMLELELLRKLDWRIVPKPEVLIEYYRSLVDRSDKFELAATDAASLGAQSATQSEQGQ